MSVHYGKFAEKAGSWTLDKLPSVGTYEYIYRNKDILLRVDQFGVRSCQIDPPVGISLVKRENREISSPVEVFFSVGDNVYNNFDVYRAKDLRIDFQPEKAIYRLDFGAVEVRTELLVTETDKRFIMRLSFVNRTSEPLSLRLLPCAYPYVNELAMAAWDKPEWYTRTTFVEGETPAFYTTRYSVAGKREERRVFTCVTSLPITSFELSAERLLAATGNFQKIPSAFTGETEKELYAFEQCFAGIADVSIGAQEVYECSFVFAASVTQEGAVECMETSKRYLCDEAFETEEKRLQKHFEQLFSVRTVKTKDENFNAFVNGFLPLELNWVCALDRGWPTGMRGVRDAANDFEGYLPYDRQLCGDVIRNIFSRQRSDGWYPRQVPFGNGEKFDLRQFVDSACFFTEYVYDYLAYTDDRGILTEKFPYYDKAEEESGLQHLIRGMEYLMQAENIGEHGLVKIRGGDWLDCLNAAGQQGRGETVMVSCQLVMCLRYLAEILQKCGMENGKYLAFADTLATQINTVAYNEKGFYNGVFTDRGEWVFSQADPDGESRVYVPTNSYAVISGVADGKQSKVIENIQSLRTRVGYKLFSEPFGVKPVQNIGKMGTGDFQPYFAENASVYNHGSQYFYIRALATAGEHEKLYDVLNFAMPFNEGNHAEKEICSAPYAITNCYHLIPGFYGRAGMSFLTGSVAMLERAVYNWVFGVRFTLNDVEIKPCIPKQYEDADIVLPVGSARACIHYAGYGTKIVAAKLDGVDIRPKENGAIRLAKSAFDKKDKVQISLTVR